MPAKNLIDMRQLRIEQLSGYMQQLVTGYVIPYVSGVSGALSTEMEGTGVLGFRVSIASGVDTVHVLYGDDGHENRKAVTALGTSGTNDPGICHFIITSNGTGQAINLSAPTPSSNYYLNLLIPV